MFIERDEPRLKAVWYKFLDDRSIKAFSRSLEKIHLTAIPIFIMGEGGFLKPTYKFKDMQVIGKITSERDQYIKDFYPELVELGE